MANVDRVLVATGNPNKLRELQTVAARFSLNLISPKQLMLENNLEAPPDVDETASNYRENALLKAQAYAEWAGLPALGDDSGLEVVCLDNRPGVHSARYAGVDANDADRIAKLLSEINTLEEREGPQDRTAYFRCELCLFIQGRSPLFTEGALAGKVLDEPRGEGGFGYDPIILIDSLGCTLSEVDFAITCLKGFRALAAEKLFKQLVAIQ